MGHAQIAGQALGLGSRSGWGGPMLPERDNPSILARVSTQLAAIEKRDGELWLIVTMTGIIVGAGLLALAFPAAFWAPQSIRVQLVVPRELFLGLLALLILFNTYVVSRRMELRRTRSALIATAIESESARLQSFTDPLTEVFNRRCLNDMATKYISRAKRLKNPLTFMLIDADHFKEVNTRFGHLTGDLVLAEIATLLRSVTRGTDAVIRYGGDEFVIMLADSGLEHSAVVGSRITNSLQEWNAAGHLKDFTLSLSMGFAEWSEGRTLEQVLDEADRTMYSAKEMRIPVSK
jgi:diguanylate cyclase (GGDEF)-like protein